MMANAPLKQPLIAALDIGTTKIACLIARATGVVRLETCYAIPRAAQASAVTALV